MKIGASAERMTDEAGIAVDDTPRSTNHCGSVVEVRVPASAGNLGAGFDCFGLALQLYLTVRVTVDPQSMQPFRMSSRGAGYGTTLSPTADNLIFHALSFAAQKQGLTVPPISIDVENEIPLGSGLGSSAAAIIAGIALCAALCDRDISDDLVLRYATELEGHSDNVAAIIAVSPHATLETARARAVLAPLVSHADAVHNLQRAALFTAALEAHRYDLLWEATRDRLHQERRESLVPGLADALATPRRPGLLGLALSGAGPSVLALARDHFDELGMAIAECFHKHGLDSTVRLLDVDDLGRQVKRLRW